jgi:hypothetical protein
MKAQAMKPPKESQKLKAPQHGDPPDDCTHQSPDEETEADESDFDEFELQDSDDSRWDVFVLDDDGDPLPEYGDFWFPD